MSAEKKKSTKAKVVESDALHWRSYLEKTRDLRTGIVLVLPLFLLYQVGVVWTGGVRNGVDFVTSAMWWVAQHNTWAYLGINLLILLCFLGVVVFLKGGRRFDPRLWPGVLVESGVYAFFFGGAVVQLMSVFGLDATLAQGVGEVSELGVMQKIVLSLGAGLYEEVVFRLIGVGGVYWGLRKAVKELPSWVAAVIAVVGTSVVFSAIHYIGSMGDAFTLGSFLFRFFAGLLLAVIFYLRGFAVAVYTHAIYDIIVMVFRGEG